MAGKIEIQPKTLEEQDEKFEENYNKLIKVKAPTDWELATEINQNLEDAGNSIKDYRQWVADRAKAFKTAEGNNTTIAGALMEDHSSLDDGLSAHDGEYTQTGLTYDDYSGDGDNGNDSPSDPTDVEVDPDPESPGLDPENPSETPAVEVNKEFILDLLSDVLRDLLLDQKLSDDTKAEISELYEGLKKLTVEGWEGLEQDIELLKEMRESKDFDEFLKAVTEELKDVIKVPEDGKAVTTNSYIVGLISKIAAGGDDAEDAKLELEEIYNKVKGLKEAGWNNVLDNFDILKSIKDAKSLEELTQTVIKKFVKDDIIGYDIVDLLKNYTGTEEQKAELQEIYDKIHNITKEEWNNITNELNLAEAIGEFIDFDKLLEEIKDGSIVKDTYLGDLYKDNKELITGVIGSLITDLSISEENKEKLKELANEQWEKLKKEINVEKLKKIVEDFKTSKDEKKLVEDIEALIKDTKLEDIYKDNKELVTGVIESIASELPEIDDETKQKLKDLAAGEWKDISEKLNLVELMEEYESIDKLVEAIKEGPFLEKLGLKELFEENSELVTGTIETIVSDILMSKNIDEAKSKLEVYYKRLSGLTKAGWEDLKNELALLTKFKESASLDAFLENREWLLSTLMGIDTQGADQVEVDKDKAEKTTLETEEIEPESEQTELDEDKAEKTTLETEEIEPESEQSEIGEDASIGEDALTSPESGETDEIEFNDKAETPPLEQGEDNTENTEQVNLENGEGTRPPELAGEGDNGTSPEDVTMQNDITKGQLQKDDQEEVSEDAEINGQASNTQPAASV